MLGKEDDPASYWVGKVTFRGKLAVKLREGRSKTEFLSKKIAANIVSLKICIPRNTLPSVSKPYNSPGIPWRIHQDIVVLMSLTWIVQ